MVTCTRTTQRVSTDNLQLNRIERMLCKNVNSYSCITCVNVNGHHWNANSCLLETVYMYPDSYSYQCQRSLKLPSLNVRVDGDWEVQTSCYFDSLPPTPTYLISVTSGLSQLISLLAIVSLRPLETQPNFPVQTLPPCAGLCPTPCVIPGGFLVVLC